MRRPPFARPPRLPHLIRFRLTLWYTGLAALVLALFVGSVFYAFRQYQFDTYNDYIRQLVTRTFEKQVVYYQHCPRYYQLPPGQEQCVAYAPPTLEINDPNALNRPDASMQFMTLDGRPLTAVHGVASSPPANSVLNTKTAKNEAHKVASGHGAVKSDATFSNGQRLLTMQLSAYGQKVIAQIAAPMTHVETQVDQLKYILIYVAGILLLISAIGGWLLAGRALKPVDEITRRARQITANDLSQRLNIDQEDELGRMASTFDEMIARLEEAFERQKRFTSDASHELRTPLTVMQADLGLALARPRSADEYRQTLVSMDEEVERLSTIVSDLLMLTRIDIDPAGMKREPIALREMLQSLTRRVRVIATERTITVSADHLDAVTVTGDATRLRQLFTNLLDNAVSYTPDGGQVSVALEKTREGARVTIRDTGIGIPAESLPRIFERFYRTDGARAHNAHGTGLGLAISRSVVQAHHGEIGVQSDVGKGTTFTVVLPQDGRARARRVSPLRAVIPGVSAAR